MACCLRCGAELPVQRRGRPRKYCVVKCLEPFVWPVPADMAPGSRFGRLVVLAYRHSASVDVRCDCGSEQTVYAGSLRKGHTRSCGCLRRKASGERFRTHGMSTSSEYRAWSNIKGRIFDPAHQSYKDYGGRGLTMDPEFAESFEAFLAEVGPKPSPELSIDRIDNDLGYVPGNLRWATAAQQNANKRRRVA